MAFSSISTDMYLPAMPMMSSALHAAAGSIELTISSYLAGFSLGQLVWGPAGDKYGRRRPIMIGLVLFTAGSVGCAMAANIHSMIAWRLLQAFGASACVVLARAMVRDLYVGRRSAQMMSTLMTIMSIGPLLAPSLGGQIMHFLSWRAIFWTLAGGGLLTIAALCALPETLPYAHRSHESLKYAFVRYTQLLKNRRILGYGGVSSFFYCGLFAYIAGTPFTYITYHHVLPQHYGALFALGVFGIMATNLINSKLVIKIDSDRLMRFGTLAATVSGLILAIDAWTDWGGLTGLVIPLFLFMSATGFIVANAIAGALGVAPERAGAVSALIGSIQYGSGILGAALVGFFQNGTPWPMACIIFFSGLGALMCALLFVPTVKNR